MPRLVIRLRIKYSNSLLRSIKEEDMADGYGINAEVLKTATGVPSGTPGASTPINPLPSTSMTPAATPPALSPDLQAIIRQVTSYATGGTGPGRQSAAQGRVLLGLADKLIGRETSLTQSSMAGQAGIQQAGITQAGATERTGMGIGNTEKMVSDRLGKTITSDIRTAGGIGGMKEPLVSDKPKGSGYLGFTIDPTFKNYFTQ